MDAHRSIRLCQKRLRQLQQLQALKRSHTSGIENSGDKNNTESLYRLPWKPTGVGFCLIPPRLSLLPTS